MLSWVKVVREKGEVFSQPGGEHIVVSRTVEVMERNKSSRSGVTAGWVCHSEQESRAERTSEPEEEVAARVAAIEPLDWRSPSQMDCCKGRFHRCVCLLWVPSERPLTLGSLLVPSMPDCGSPTSK